MVCQCKDEIGPEPHGTDTQGCFDGGFGTQVDPTLQKNQIHPWRGIDYSAKKASPADERCRKERGEGVKL